MTKYDLAKLFGDVDDRFIEGVKPEVQKPIKLTAKRRSPLKILAAASCAAVVLTGGIVTANVLHNRGMSALEGSNTASIVKNNSKSPNETDDGRIFDMQTGNWFTENEIYYEGEYYKVPQNSRIAYKLRTEEKEVAVLTGIRRISPNIIEMVTVMVNHLGETAQIRCYGADSVVEMQFAPERKSHAGEISISDNMSSKPFGHTLQPGEMCFQKGIYYAGLGNYEGKIKYAYQVDNAHNSCGLGSNTFYIVMTEDGFKEHYEAYEFEYVEGTDGDYIANDGFLYNGRYYRVTDSCQNAINELKAEDILLKTLVGYRKNDDGSIDIVTAFKNNFDKPIVLSIKDNYGLGIVISENLDGQKNNSNVSEQMILQPGEICFYENKTREKDSEQLMYTFSVKSENRMISVPMLDHETDFSEDEEPFDYVTDLDGDGIPDAYKEANPDITPEQWEIIKDHWAHEWELEQKD